MAEKKKPPKKAKAKAAAKTKKKAKAPAKPQPKQGGGNKTPKAAPKKQGGRRVPPARTAEAKRINAAHAAKATDPSAQPNFAPRKVVRSPGGQRPAPARQQGGGSKAPVAPSNTTSKTRTAPKAAARKAPGFVTTGRFRPERSGTRKNPSRPAPGFARKATPKEPVGPPAKAAARAPGPPFKNTDVTARAYANAAFPGPKSSPGPHKFRAATAHNKAAMKAAHARETVFQAIRPDKGKDNPARIQNFDKPAQKPGTVVGRDASGKAIAVVGGEPTAAQHAEARKEFAKRKAEGGGGRKTRRATGGSGRGRGAPRPANLTAPPTRAAPTKPTKPTRAAPNLTAAADEDAKPLKVVARPQPEGLGNSAGNFGGLKRQGSKRRRRPAAVLDLPPNKRRRGVR